jgi:hypothetical protein
MEEGRRRRRVGWWEVREIGGGEGAPPAVAWPLVLEPLRPHQVARLPVRHHPQLLVCRPRQPVPSSPTHGEGEVVDECDEG